METKTLYRRLPLLETLTVAAESAAEYLDQNPKFTESKAAALQHVMDQLGRELLPMDSAPRDGTSIIVLHGDGSTVGWKWEVTQWSEGFGQFRNLVWATHMENLKGWLPLPQSQAEARGATMSLVWSSEVPTEAGWYWKRTKGVDAYRGVQFVRITLGGVVESDAEDFWVDPFAQWAGPIPFPSEPEAEKEGGNGS